MNGASEKNGENVTFACNVSRPPSESSADNLPNGSTDPTAFSSVSSQSGKVSHGVQGRDAISIDTNGGPPSYQSWRSSEALVRTFMVDKIPSNMGLYKVVLKSVMPAKYSLELSPSGRRISIQADNLNESESNGVSKGFPTSEAGVEKKFLQTKSLCRKVITHILKDFSELRLAESVATDYDKYIVTVNPIRNVDKDAHRIYLQQRDWNGDSSFTEVWFYLEEQSLAKDSDERIPNTTKALNVMLKRSLESSRPDHIRFRDSNSLFELLDEDEEFFRKTSEGWRMTGFHSRSGVNMVVRYDKQSDNFLVDLVSTPKAFHNRGKLIDLILGIYGKNASKYAKTPGENGSPETPFFEKPENIAGLRKLLLGLKVQYLYKHSKASVDSTGGEVHPELLERLEDNNPDSCRQIRGIGGTADSIELSGPGLGGSSKTVAKYFRNRILSKGKDLKYSHLPVVQVGSSSRPVWVPMEMLWIAPHQQLRCDYKHVGSCKGGKKGIELPAATMCFSSRDPMHATREFETYGQRLCSRPGFSLELIDKTHTRLNVTPATKNLLNTRIAPELAGLGGALLNQVQHPDNLTRICIVHTTPSSGSNANAPTTSQRRHQKQQARTRPQAYQSRDEYREAKLGAWARKLGERLKYFSGGQELHVVDNIFRLKEGKSLFDARDDTQDSLRPSEDIIILVLPAHNGQQQDKVIKADCARIMQEACNAGFIIFTTSDSSLHLDNAQTEPNSPYLLTMRNLAIRINFALGGDRKTVRLHRKEFDPIKNKRRQRVMFCGASLNHHTSGHFIEKPSIAALTANIMGDIQQYSQQYRGSLRLQAPYDWNTKNGANREKRQLRSYIIDLEMMMTERLKAFKATNNNHLPDVILYYRHGLSSGDIRQVRQREMDAIKTAWEKLHGEEDKNGAKRQDKAGVEEGPSDEKPQTGPEVCYVVVNSHSNPPVHFTAGNSKVFDETASFVPGEIFDAPIATQYSDMDFYIQSHKSSGGERVSCGHYTVKKTALLDKARIKTITFDLCHANPEPKTTKLPSPVNFSDRLCDLGRKLLQDFYMELIKQPNDSILSGLRDDQKAVLCKKIRGSSAEVQEQFPSGGPVTEVMKHLSNDTPGTLAAVMTEWPSGTVWERDASKPDTTFRNPWGESLDKRMFFV